MSDRTGSSSIVFSTGSKTNYKKLSLAAIKGIANARFLKLRLSHILDHPDKFVGKLMDHLETEYC